MLNYLNLNERREYDYENLHTQVHISYDYNILWCLLGCSGVLDDGQSTGSDPSSAHRHNCTIGDSYINWEVAQ